MNMLVLTYHGHQELSDGELELHITGVVGIQCWAINFPCVTLEHQQVSTLHSALCLYYSIDGIHPHVNNERISGNLEYGQ